MLRENGTLQNFGTDFSHGELFLFFIRSTEVIAASRADSTFVFAAPGRPVGPATDFVLVHRVDDKRRTNPLNRVNNVEA
jgi:hypothetical protein